MVLPPEPIVRKFLSETVSICGSSLFSTRGRRAPGGIRSLFIEGESLGQELKPD
ncbi:hypothetical protein H7X64_05120 [Armatimonadetes bacterium]|nr:hypothetical protein [bacterium]